jgi:hypothetical protein
MDNFVARTMALSGSTPLLISLVGTWFRIKCHRRMGKMAMHFALTGTVKRQQLRNHHHQQ